MGAPFLRDTPAEPGGVSLGAVPPRIGQSPEKLHFRGVYGRIATCFSGVTAVKSETAVKSNLLIDIPMKMENTDYDRID